MNESETNEMYLTVGTHDPTLSIIIPAYNEENRLPDTLEKIIDWMQRINFAVEVLIVENGSQDRTTEIANSYSSRFHNITVLHSPKGKGAAVRVGMFQSKGIYSFICDADLSMPIVEVEKFLPLCGAGVDIVIGSREAPGAKRYNEPIHRHIVGRIFNFMVRVLAVPNFQDTQCGFKLFKSEVAREIFMHQTISGWSFDVEAIYIGLRHGYHIAEVPINWFFNRDSRVSVVRDIWRMFSDLVKIRLNGWRGIYDKPLILRTTEQS